MTETKPAAIRTLLVANRGEIARRIMATCRELGIGTVAVFSDPDADAPHVREADAAVRLPGAAPAQTYLRADLIVRAALDAGADAVHPGYGFLAENADFAAAVVEAGLTWVGPPAAAIASMGSKTEAKRLVAAAGVPVLGAIATERATAADLPLLIKASAGGGGRGMRVVRTLEELPAALASARTEAASAFGSDEVFCEPYLESARHIEAQLMVDAHGTVWVVGERDCSIQRRHQKIVEEAPAPGLTDEVRRALKEAATAAARAVRYVGAGTVEFLLSPEGRLFFLEVNTRLQVEHPVTESVTGLDLVALQLRIAEGGTLPGAVPEPRGHAIEARLCAEDPAQDWLPQIGALHRLDVPGVTVRFGTAAAETGLRLDSGVENGSVIGTDYDSLIAKVIAWAPTRTAAARKLANALTRARIHGLTTNRDLLVRVLRHPAFLDGGVNTQFLEEYRPELINADTTADKDGADKDSVHLAALAAALADAAANRATAPVLRGLPSGWRNVPSQPQVKRYRPAGDAAGEEFEVRYRFARGGLEVDGSPDTRLIASAPDHVVLEVQGIRRTFAVATYPDDRTIYVDSPLGSVALTAVDRFPGPETQAETGGLLAPMPGTVVRIAATEGDPVTAGQPLLWLEAMKMEHRITAPTDGILTALRVGVGQQVDVGAVLAVIDLPGQ
jgi:propionyl-CoA carboxylase alpha chain